MGGSAKVKNCGLRQNVKTLSFWTFIFLVVVSVKSIPDEGWYIADPEVSCDTACQKNNMLCTVDGMKAHNGDVDSPEKVLSLIKSLGEEFNEPTCHNDHGHYPVVPVFTKQSDNNYRRPFCFSTDPRKVQFSCSAKDDNEGKQRLCYCNKGIVNGDCYEDKDAPNRMLTGKSTLHLVNNSPSQCYSYCQGFKYYAVQYTNECFCGDTLQHLVKRPTNECNAVCPGDSSKKCGSSYRLNL